MQLRPLRSTCCMIGVFIITPKHRKLRFPGPEGIMVYQMIDTHFFKGTVPWGPCPAPFLASVTRQATILYAESSSTMLHNYVNYECSGSQVHAWCLCCQIVAVSLTSPGHWIQTVVTKRVFSKKLKNSEPRTDQIREITHTFTKVTYFT